MSRQDADAGMEGRADLPLTITAAMIAQFAELTGDFSSLHTDAAFGQASMYRQNVAHGMLPLLFLTTMPLPQRSGYCWQLRRLVAQFQKPVFGNEPLILRTDWRRDPKAMHLVEGTYGVVSGTSGAAYSTGSVRWEQVPEPKDAIRPAATSGAAPAPCMLKTVLTERVRDFDDIVKDESERLDFVLVPSQVSALRRLLHGGGAPNCEVANFLGACLLSTLVGMRTPGRNATFGGFEIDFCGRLEWDTKYALTSTVSFKSASTSTVLLTLQIAAGNASGEHVPLATGKVSAQVNRGAVKMPSSQQLKDTARDLQLQGKVVLITGASRGLGETMAKLLAIHGASVVVNYSRSAAAAQVVVDEIVAAGGEALALMADVREPEQVTSMVAQILERFGRLDVLVNNAASDAYPTPFLELTWERQQVDIDVILKGAFCCCQAVLPTMIKQGGGKIINISTVFVELPPPHQTKYVVAKSALTGLTRSLAVEFGPKNIQVNMVVPSLVETDFAKNVPKVALVGLKNAAPMKRLASPVDVAKAVVFLASSLSSYTTGQKIMVTGGTSPLL